MGQRLTVQWHGPMQYGATQAWGVGRTNACVREILLAFIRTYGVSCMTPYHVAKATSQVAPYGCSVRGQLDNCQHALMHAYQE